MNDFSSIQGLYHQFVDVVQLNSMMKYFCVSLEIGFIPSHANNSITSDHNTFANELNNMPNVTIPTSLVGNIAEGGHSPNHNSMISSQILGSTPLNQIGCTLPIDPYAG